MFDDAQAHDAPLEIEAHQRVDRMPGIRRNAENIVRQIRIAEQALALINGGGRWLAFEVAEAVGLREKIPHRGIKLVDRLGVRRGGHPQKQEQRKQAKSRAPGKSRRVHKVGTKHGPESTLSILMQGDYRGLDFSQARGGANR